MIADNGYSKTYDGSKALDNPRVNKYLIEMNESLGYQIYDPETGEVTVEDPKHLTESEYHALLAITTGDIDVYQFAAEVEWHADNVGNWKEKIPGKGKEWRESAIRADMGLGEENESGYFGFDRNYYDTDSTYYQKQKDEHFKERAWDEHLKEMEE